MKQNRIIQIIIFNVTTSSYGNGSDPHCHEEDYPDLRHVLQTLIFFLVIRDSSPIIDETKDIDHQSEWFNARFVSFFFWVYTFVRSRQHMLPSVVAIVDHQREIIFVRPFQSWRNIITRIVSIQDCLISWISPQQSNQTDFHHDLWEKARKTNIVSIQFEIPHQWMKQVFRVVRNTSLRPRTSSIFLDYSKEILLRLLLPWVKTTEEIDLR